MRDLEKEKLVARIEEDLERTISRGELPKGGGLPSERTLARNYGVARGTVRAALLRLSTRGLLEQRQGRQARALEAERAVTLESLGMALHAVGSARTGWRRLLEGYFELKRETTVELLVRCCEQGSEKQRGQLETACFTLKYAAHWDDGSGRWVEQEFELLRMAALLANRPGHFLLVKSLERAFRGMSEALRPHLTPEAVDHWSQQTLYWLGERNVEALRKELPALLQACDERVLGSLWPEPPKQRP
jgi:DNA-binding FadR family transcriptional regulator